MAAPFARLLPEVSMPGLVATVRSVFDTVPDARRAASVKHSMGDTLSAALAMFQLKYPSLLKFDEAVRFGETDVSLRRARVTSTPIYARSPDGSSSGSAPPPSSRG